MRCSGRLGDSGGPVAHRAEAWAVGAVEGDGSGPDHDGRLELRVLLLLQRHEGPTRDLIYLISLRWSFPPDSAVLLKLASFRFRCGVEAEDTATVVGVLFDSRRFFLANDWDRCCDPGAYRGVHVSRTTARCMTERSS